MHPLLTGTSPSKNHSLPSLLTPCVSLGRCEVNSSWAKSVWERKGNFLVFRALIWKRNWLSIFWTNICLDLPFRVIFFWSPIEARSKHQWVVFYLGVCLIFYSGFLWIGVFPFLFFNLLGCCENWKSIRDGVGRKERRRFRGAGPECRLESFGARVVVNHKRQI